MKGVLVEKKTNLLEKKPTQRLQCSSLLVMTYFPLRDYNILPKKELRWSLCVCSCIWNLDAFCSEKHKASCAKLRALSPGPTKVPKTMAQDPKIETKIETTGSMGSLFLAAVWRSR